MGIILFIVGVIGWHIGMYGLFKKAGLNPFFALIPFYNTWLIVQKINLPRYWFFLQLIPIAGQFITIWITIIFMMHFKRVNVIDHTLTTVLPFLFFPYIGFNKTDKWYGQEGFNLYKKPISREWIDAGAFAIVAATIIRTFVFEAYVIPTGSMERTLLINDFLFVSKFSYGPRIPQTPLSFPFVHNTLPFSQTVPSYIRQVQVPYTRINGYTHVKRNDVVVFNFPAGDTIINLPEYGSKIPYYDVLRSSEYNGNRDALNANFPLLVHPADKTDNYIKRCVAVAGDKFEIKEGVLFVNNQKAFHAPDMQTDYEVQLSKALPTEFLEDELGIDITVDEENNRRYNINGDYDEVPGGLQTLFNLTMANVDILKKRTEVVSIVPSLAKKTDANMFPFDTVNFRSNADNFGPITVPKKGDVVTLTYNNLELYRRLITNYEGNTLETGTNGKFKINGVETNTYTIKLNYYWMMGDNRHRSQDSRYWGFVPETMVVGKASLVWFSWNKGPRWKRIFKSIH
jgi:signal peptidase I